MQRLSIPAFGQMSGEQMYSTMQALQEERDRLQLWSCMGGDEEANVYMAHLLIDARVTLGSSVFVRESEIADIEQSGLSDMAKSDVFRHAGDVWFAGFDPAIATATLRRVPASRYYATSDPRNRVAMVNALYKRAVAIDNMRDKRREALRMVLRRISDATADFVRLIDATKCRIGYGRDSERTRVEKFAARAHLNVGTPELTQMLTEVVSNFHDARQAGIPRADLRATAHHVGAMLRARGADLSVERIDAMFDS